jgi:hypothetical protein
VCVYLGWKWGVGHGVRIRGDAGYACVAARDGQGV